MTATRFALACLVAVPATVMVCGLAATVWCERYFLPRIAGED